MKKTIKIILATLIILAGLAGCSTKESDETAETADPIVIKVGASVTPHAEILNVAKEILADEGYDLQIIEYNDYVLPNTATESGELLANYFQHVPYLTNFNAENGTHLVAVAAIHYEPYGIYAGKTTSLDALADGATIAVPNDSTNEARALQLLAAQGLITLKEGVGLEATVLDIVDNPKNLQIQELEAAQLTRVLPDVDLAVINGNYAIEAGLKVSEALAVEDKDSEAAQTYANVLVVKEGNEDNEAVKALIKALQSDKVRDFINDTYDGAVIPLF
ncbi:MAG: MetQ/NlpA family ABC transporter substrate-binding protein [Erysipelotrichaceae bacterium]|nr:MetQ/NlpA family ABC transporter substrate-binding protein [Erysipelotrichaceae bacterium]